MIYYAHIGDIYRNICHKLILLWSISTNYVDDDMKAAWFKPVHCLQSNICITTIIFRYARRSRKNYRRNKEYMDPRKIKYMIAGLFIFWLPWLILILITDEKNSCGADLMVAIFVYAKSTAP